MEAIIFREKTSDSSIRYRLNITTEDPHEKLVLKEMLSQPEISEIREKHQKNMKCVKREISPKGWDVRPRKNTWEFGILIEQSFPFGVPEHLKKIGHEIEKKG